MASGVGLQSISRFMVGRVLNFGSSKQLHHHLGFVVVYKHGRSCRTWTCSSTTNTKSKDWADFAEKVSGEWDGYGADFSKGGEPMELPESVVPEAYREWEVKVYDWQTQCPTLARPAHPFHLSYKLIKLLPTVGCEADAATIHSILRRNILLVNNTTSSSTSTPNNDDGGGGRGSGQETITASAFAYQSNGCYLAVWPAAAPLDHDDGNRRSNSTRRVAELEHCLVDPRDPHSRVRIIQEVKHTNNMMQLERIKVFREQWFGPFQNGQQLGGCTIRGDSAFASTPALRPSKISGTWHVFHCAVATFQHTSSTPQKEEEDVMIMNIRRLVVMDGEYPRSCSRDGTSLIMLPKQLWCSSNQQLDRSGQTCCFQVGWLLDDGLGITSKFSFSPDAILKEISITCETKTEIFDQLPTNYPML